jgi:hypothetical protein
MLARSVAVLLVLVPLVGSAQKSDPQVLKDFGAEVMKSAPPEVRKGSPIDQARYGYAKYCEAPKDLKGLSKEQLQVHLDALKAWHRELQDELTALPPGSDSAGNQIRAEQKALFQEVMRLKQELSTRP